MNNNKALILQLAIASTIVLSIFSATPSISNQNSEFSSLYQENSI